MALTAGVVLAMPDIACIGMVSKVGDVKLSQSGVYHVLPVEIKAKYSGKDGTTFVTFEPRWFARDFNPKTFQEEGRDGFTKSGMYRRTVADEKKPAMLQVLLGENFAAAAAEFDEIGEPTAEEVADVIRRHALGNEVGYVSYQRVDEGELMEMYNIKYFFPLNDDSRQQVIDQSKDPKRRRGELVITWDE